MPAFSPANRSEFFLGMRLFAPIALSIAAYGVVWGVLAGQAGLSTLEVFLMSGLVYAGSSQFVALTLWMPPTSPPILDIVIAVAIINLRMLLMTATLRPLMADTPRWRAAALMFFVADEVWALSMSQLSKGKGSVAFLFGTGVLAWLTWEASTLTGRLLGAVISDPRTYGLDFAFTATFLALLFGMWKGRGDIIPWAVGGFIAVVTARLVPGQWYIVVGGLGGSLAGALAETWRQRNVAR